MNRLGELLRRLLILGIGIALFVGIPMWIGHYGHMWWSWIPASIAMEYLDDV